MTIAVPSSVSQQPRQIVVIPDIAPFLTDGWTLAVIEHIMEWHATDTKVYIGAPTLSQSELFGDDFHAAWTAWSADRDGFLVVLNLLDSAQGPVFTQFMPGANIDVLIAPKELCEVARAHQKTLWEVLTSNITIDPALCQALLSYLADGQALYGTGSSCLHTHPVREVVIKEFAYSKLRTGVLAANEPVCICD